jgi:site-specific recombinase XerD
MYTTGQLGEGMFEQTESQKTIVANELKHLSESELLDVLECARKTSSRDHALLVVAYTHGLRNQEIARLRLADLNWKSQEITIHRLKNSLNTVQPIVRHRVRPALCEMTALRLWLKERRRSNDPTDFVFVSKKGGSLGQKQVNRLFAEYCELASLARIARGEAPIANSVRHVHCLKHSRGTSLAERGVNPYRIKLILGHKSMSSTERYPHGSQKQAWAEAQRFSMEVF